MSTPASSIYESGASNVDIIESLSSDLIGEPSPAPAPGTADTGGSGATGTAELPAAGAAGAAEAAPVERPEWFETAPTELKTLLEQKNISAEGKKWLEQTYGELHGFKASPVGTPEVVSEIAEMYPGGLEEMREAHQNAQEFVREMAQFESGDPSQQTELLATLIQRSPDAFVAMLPAAADLLKATLRDDYTAFASNMAHDHLESITDGKFAQFFEGVKSMADKYNGLLETNPEEAAKLASKLGGAALQMADWWGSAKNKLGYGERGAAPVGTGRQPVVSNQPDQREVSLAQREATFWSSNYMLKHDGMVNPTIGNALSRELAARKMTDLPKTWQEKIVSRVADGIKQNLSQDKSYQSLETRIYHRGQRNDPRKWNNSDEAARQLLAAAKQRADKLIPSLLKAQLDEISQLRGTPARPTQAAAAVRGGGGTPAGGAGGGSNATGWEEDMKAGKITTAQAVARIAGL